MRVKIYIESRFSQFTVEATRFPATWKRLVEQLIPAEDRRVVSPKSYAFRAKWANVVEWISTQCFDTVWIYEDKDKDEDTAKNDNNTTDSLLVSQLKIKITQLEKQREQCEREHKTNADANELLGELRGSYLLSTVYKLLAKHYHPDITKDDGTKMKEINALFGRLGD